MKLLIAGSRDIDDFELDEYIPGDVDLIITGGASGVDSLAEKYADKKKISKLILRPDYKRYGKAAPIMRNKRMIEIADMVIVVWNGHSRGTKATLDYARKAEKKLLLINVDN